MPKLTVEFLSASYIEHRELSQMARHPLRIDFRNAAERDGDGAPGNLLW